MSGRHWVEPLATGRAGYVVLRRNAAGNPVQVAHRDSWSAALERKDELNRVCVIVHELLDAAESDQLGAPLLRSVADVARRRAAELGIVIDETEALALVRGVVS